MVDVFVDPEKENQKEEDSLSKNNELEQHNLVENIPGCKHWSIVRGSKPQRKLIFNFNQIKGLDSWVQGLFLNSSHGLQRSSIPKHLVSVDEKYLRFCLEAIQVSALKSAPCDISVNPNHPVYIQYLSDSYGSSQVLSSSFELDEFVIGYPVGSITESNSMLNILKSPIFQRLGPLSKEANVSFDCGSSQKLENDFLGYRSDVSHSNFQGMLQCTWKSGLPYFEFSIDDQKEIYVANAFKAEVSNDKSLDYIYTFHSKYNIPDDDFHGESDLMGKMRVSTSLSLCPNNSKVAETEFVLYGINEAQVGDFQINSRIGKRRRKLSKVMEVLKHNQTGKRKSETSGLSQPMNKIDLLQSGFLPELELGAIVVKDHIQEETGGWGLKFLKKAGSRQSCSDCSTSIDIILPAGFHGRPATANSGPWSILERWRSDGHCDCGGWDVGCPLTILKSIPRIDDCKSFNIFTEGSDEGTPVVKMTNVHEGLYYITFRSSLPILQCFAIAVAMVHSHSPMLSRKHVQM